MALTKGKLLCIEDFPLWGTDITILFPESNGKSFFYGETYIEPIKRYLAEKDVQAKIELSHPKISGAICFSKQELIEVIVANV